MAKKRILVAEDEEPVRLLLTECLREAGYDVTPVSDGLQALYQSPAKFDLLITDVKMPRVSGTELVKGIRRNGIEIPILVITGFIDKETKLLRNIPNVAVINKPFEIDALLIVLEQLFGKSA